jgi:glucose-1-phosphate thymidylyltransferase
MIFMDAAVLCGGFAKRLWPLTKDRPKPLLPVSGKPILEYILERVEKLDCIDKIYISVNKRFEGQFKDFIRHRKTNRITELVVEPAGQEEEKLGSIGALKFLMENKKIDKDLIVIAGDNLFNFDLTEAAGFFRKIRKPVVVLYDCKSKEKVKRKFGVAVLDGSSRVTGFQEKPESPKSALISTGIYIFPKDVLKLMFEYLEERNNPDAPGFFIQWLHRKIPVYGFIMKGNWFDIGSLEDYKAANKFIF